MKRQSPRFSRELLADFWLVTVPFFRSSAKKKAWGALAILTALLFLVSGVNVITSYINRDLMNALAERRSESFFYELSLYFAAFVVATLIGVYYRYTEERLALSWREWMTQHLLKKYFSRRRYYHLRSNAELDNPDQRIAEDVKNFTATSLSLLLITMNSIITVVAFIGVIGSISTTLLVVLIAYAFAGTFFSILIGRRLVRLHYRQYNREANFRYGLIRVRDNAESVAFYRGEARERIDLGTRFVSVYRNTRRLITWNRNLAFFSTSYNYIALLVPIAVVGPLYLNQSVEFGVVTQATSAFAQVLAALSLIITQFERLSAFSAAVARISGLWKALAATDLDEDEEDSEVEVVEGSRLKLSDLTVRPPKSSRNLIEELNLSLKPHEGLLIMGRSGTGKSSLLRTIAGLWNSGDGTIARPRLQEMMFLPQRPYMPPGNLRSQILYPVREKVSSEGDLRLRAVLKSAQLEELLDRVDGDLSRTMDWPNILSLGEQQRLAFARVLLRDPKLVFLDEATSALDEENESLLYGEMKKRGSTFVSVGHRSTLKEFHDRLLILSEDGKWDFE